MKDKNNKIQTNQSFSTQKEYKSQNTENTGIYLRDDHCDWGSSGMNEFTNEYGENS